MASRVELLVRLCVIIRILDENDGIVIRQAWGISKQRGPHETN